MRNAFTVCLLCVLLSGCSGWNVSLSDNTNAHFRTLANLTPEQGDKEALAFDIRKRPQSIMAGKTLYQNGDFSVSANAGRHRQYRWMAGLTFDYAF
jgi:hypothetical protein